MTQRVLFIIDTLQTGGAERSLLQIISRFKRYQPVVVLLFNKRHDLKADYIEAGIEVIELNLPDTLAFWRLAKQVSEKLSDLTPVLIHATLFKSDMTSRYLARRMQVPLVNSFVNNSYSSQRYRSEPWSIKIKLWLLQQWDALTARRVTLFLSNSETIRKTNAKALRIPVEKTKVIYRGRSVFPFDAISEEQRTAFRTSMKVVDKKVFINVSRLIDRKGQLDLVRSFAKVVEKYPNARLWLVGEGPLRLMLETEIERCGMKDYIVLLGNRPDIPLLLKSADYFVFPSHYEGLPGALIEAMMARIPVIASDILENRECVDDRMALFHPVGNHDELAKSMIIALHRTDWETKTRVAYTYAMTHFEISKVAAQYESIYDELLGMEKT